MNPLPNLLLPELEMIVLTIKMIKQKINTDKLCARRGSALMMVVILFLITSILTVAVLAVATTEHAQVIAEEKLDQAYYNARAVVQATADWISARYNDHDQMALVVPSRALLGESHAHAITSELNGDEYTLRIWRDDHNADLIHIVAETSHDGLPGRAALELQETISGLSPFADAIYTKGGFSKAAGSANRVYYGDVTTGHDVIPDNLTVVYGKKTPGKIFEFEDISPAKNIVFPPRIENAVLGSKTKVIYINDTPNLNADYGTLKLQDTVHVKNVDDATGKPRDVHIRVDYLDVTEGGHVFLHPKDYFGGRIFIYVTKRIWVSSKFTIGGYINSPAVYLICSESKSSIEPPSRIACTGNTYINAFIYAPDIEVHFGGNTTLYGAIIANVYGWNGNVWIWYRKPNLNGTPFEELNTVNINGITWK